MILILISDPTGGSRRAVANAIYNVNRLRKKGFVVFSPTLHFHQYARQFYDDYTKWVLQIITHLKDRVFVFAEHWDKSETGIILDRLAKREKIPQVNIEWLMADFDPTPGKWAEGEDTLKIELFIRTMQTVGGIVYEKELYRIMPFTEAVVDELAYLLRKQGVIKYHYGRKRVVMFHGETEINYKSERKKDYPITHEGDSV